MKSETVTLDQLMEARELVDKKYRAYERAEERQKTLENNFPECDRKIMRYKGKVYLVSTFRDLRDGTQTMSIDEVNE